MDGGRENQDEGAKLQGHPSRQHWDPGLALWWFLGASPSISEQPNCGEVITHV